ncbi:MAG TPA: hypothetical protein VGN88_08155 [Phycisphaerae bacterium]|jgi:hypothetical protein
MGSYKDSDNYRCGQSFPAVINHPIDRTSEATLDYNCFAYAAGDTKRPWSPLPIRPRNVYWPVDVSLDEEDTIWPVIYAFETLGYQLCDDGRLKNGVEKIAIYVDGRECPTHVAIQRGSGKWQSKLGGDIDVEHSLESLESTDEFGGSLYGKAKYFMSRARVT